jgi:hypothetical protein
MRRPTPAGLAGALATVVAVLASSSALAYFSGSGVGSASAGITQLTVPVLATPVVNPGGTVALNWSAVPAPDSSAVRYEVRRDGGEPGGNCPGSNPAAVTSCVDSGLSVGNHTYTVVAHWRSWSATGNTVAAKVTVGVATHFRIVAATTAPAVGGSNNLTITAKDDNGNTVTTYTGSRSLTFSGASSSPGGTAPTVVNSSGTAIAFGNATALTFSAGVASVSSSRNGLMKIYRSGPESISASDGTIDAEPALQVNVISGAPTKYTLTAPTTTPVAGSASDLTISAVDTYGNPSSSYAGVKSLTFSGASASPGGNLPTVTNSAGAAVPFGGATAIEFEEGLASTEGVANGEMLLYKSGSTSLKATDGVLTNSTALVLTVAASEASKLILTGSSATPSATGTSNLTTTAQDNYGNTATAYTGIRDIYFSGALPGPSGTAPTIVNTSGTATAFGAATALNFKSGVAAVASSRNGLLRLPLAGETSISASDGTISTATPLVLNVLVGTATRWALTGVTSSAGIIGSPCLLTCPVTALGNKGTITATVSIVDASGNTVSNVGTGRVAKATSTGGTILGTPLAISPIGPAVSAAPFVYTAPASGSFTNTITVATSSGTTYTSATATASR